ncbi:MULTISPECIES: DUF4126 domain-containing protein [Phenylobacterium]|uniref:Membrane protein n=1 Tax=Phenylobacterium koreense TaxID=266125 RepID=A0ABV2EEJ1_9CAUL
MTLYVLALLIGVVAGLRTMTAPAAMSWAAHLGLTPVAGTPLSFMAAAPTAWIFTVLALGEFVADQLPRTPSRKAPFAFGGRIVSGALCGAVIGAADGALAAGLLLGVVGAIIGTLGGYEARMRLARLFGRDLPAALIEDFIAIAGALLIVRAL